MKQQRIIIASALLLIVCSTLMAQSNKSSTQRFDDGIYSETQTTVPSETAKSQTCVPVDISAGQLASRTAQSSMYVNPSLTDTLVVPDLGSFSKKVNNVNYSDFSTNVPIDSALIYTMVPQKNYTSITINSTFSLNFGAGFYWGRPWYWNSWAWDPWCRPWDPWYRPWGPWGPGPYDPWYRPYGPYHPYGPYYPVPVRYVRRIDSTSPNSFASGIGTQTGHRREAPVNSGVSHAPRSSYNSGAVRLARGGDASLRATTGGDPGSRRYSGDGYNVAIGGSNAAGSAAPSTRSASAGNSQARSSAPTGNANAGAYRSSGAPSYSAGVSSSGHAARSYGQPSTPTYRRPSGSSGSTSNSNYKSSTSGNRDNSYYGSRRSSSSDSRSSSGSSYSGSSYSGGGYSGGGGGGTSGGGGGGGFSGGGSGHRR